MAAANATCIATIHSEALPASGVAPPCQLIVVEGPDMGRAQDLAKGDLLVGTGEDCGLVLRDERVSRHHMTVCAEGSHFVVRDLQSTNGTIYEGSMIAEARVPAGATLKLGRSFVRVQPRPQPLEVLPSQSRRFGEMVAESLSMREIFAVLELAAGSDVTVLLEGETGTGKELCARAVHDASARRKGPFVAIDCGALPEGLLESELFGHVKGAFSNAIADRAGAFVRAHGGTIFLDELGGIPLSVQARLLRVIEERTVRPLGADREKKIDVRILAAAPIDLSTKVAEGGFRPDLFYRLSVVRVVLPPLRARREDIAPIIAEHMRRRGLSLGNMDEPQGDDRGAARSAIDRLMAHHWPGNVRELRNVIDRALALSPGATSLGELRLSISPQAGDESLSVRTDLAYTQAKQVIVQNFELRYLRDVLARCEGNISAAARAAGLDRKHLRMLLRRHGLLGGGDEAEE